MSDRANSLHSIFLNVYGDTQHPVFPNEITQNTEDSKT